MKHSTLIFLLGISFSSFAQNYIDLAKFHYQNTAQNKFDSSENKTNIEEYSLNVTLPIKLNDKTAILTGFGWDRYSTALTAFGNQTSISSYLLKAGININHNDKWNGTYLLLPKLASDFKANNDENFQLGALALFKYQKNANMRYKFGLYYNGDKFGTFFVPLFGFYYKKNKFEADLTIPAAADANYRMKENLFVGMDFRAIVRSFNLTQPQRILGNEYVEQKSNEVTTYLGYEFKGILLKSQIGYTIGRSYGIYQSEDQIDWGLSLFRFGDNRTQLNSNFADGLIFRVQMVYRLYLD